MKNTIFIMAACMALSACQTNNPTNESNQVEIIYEDSDVANNEFTPDNVEFEKPDNNP